jgi:two-component system response regulator HydG
VHVPTLRERRDDIPILAAYFVKLFAADLKRKPPAITMQTIERLLSYDYPGNIRELKNTIERAIIYAGGGKLCPTHIVFAPQVGGAPASPPVDGSKEPCKAETGEASASAEGFNLETNESRLIERALRASDGNVTAAARLLGVDRAKIYRWQNRGKPEPDARRLEKSVVK